jgi:hypothetical protein
MVGGIIPLLRAASFRFDGRLEQESAPVARTTDRASIWGPFFS